jgi:hypothetical protein
MARPPERIERILPHARTVLVATVAHVQDVGPWSPSSGTPDSAAPCPAQNVRLQVREVLRGDDATTIDVRKPSGPYALQVGVDGAFLLDDSTPPAILGRYGPSTWSPDEVRAAMTNHGVHR